MKIHYRIIRTAILSLFFSSIVLIGAAQNGLTTLENTNQDKKIANSKTGNVIPNIIFKTTQTNGNNHYNYSIPKTTPNQGYCFTDQLMDALLKATHKRLQFDAEYQQMINAAQNENSSARQHYVIPIIFHVVYNTTAQNVSTSTIMSVFNELNDDYQLLNTDASNARSQFGFTAANVDVSFCLAVRDPQNNPLSEPGIDRNFTTTTYFDPNNNANDMKFSSSGGVDSWDRSRYLNVWICNISNGANSGVAGYAYSPTTSSLPPASIDGIVLDYHLAMFTGSRALTHEVGHYLGLAHTWGNSNQATSCTGAGDGINDTPITQGPSFDFPGSCSGNQETCTGTQTQYENYMDYSNCTVMFTADQVDVMQDILATSRISLSSSNACTPLNNNPPNVDFVADITTVVSGGNVNFTDLSTNFPNAWTWTITPSAGWAFTGSTNANSKNPTVQFTTPGTYTVKLTASNANGSDDNTKTDYITVIASGGGSITCDTLRNYTAAEAQNMTYFGLTGEEGYYPGHFTLNSGALQTSKMAEKFHTASSGQLRSIRFIVGQSMDMGTSGNISFKVYTDNAGFPGTVQATETMPISSLTPLDWNFVEFTTPPVVNGDFWVSFEWTNTGAFDTIAFATTDPSDRPFIDGSTTHTSTATYIDGVGWNYTSDVLGASATQAYDVSMIVDALMSNGPAPSAALSISTNEACANSYINVNGFGSTNTENYHWEFIKGTTTYVGDGGTLTFNNLPVGSWNVELHALGSCVEDVATSTLTIDPAISETINKTNENCGKGDGSITVSNITGGNGSGYSVSTNNGATFINTAPYNFTNLSAGTYITIVKDNVCADTVSVVVSDVNTFNPLLSPGTSTSINQGESVTLSVTGGSTWVWYKQGETAPFETNSASVTVSPDSTSIYTVEATDANGCSKTFTITVTVNGNAGINSEKDSHTISIYPNPSQGVFNLEAKFNSAQNLKIQVFDLLGNIIIDKDYQKTNQFILPINLSKRGNGTYVVRVIGTFGTYTHRVIVMK